MRWFDRSVTKFPLASVDDYRLEAEKRLPHTLFAFLESGAFNGITLKKNQDDFREIYLKKRILRNVSTIETSVEILGQKLPFPLLLAPVGFAGCFARQGEILAAKASFSTSIPFVLSIASICPLEEVAKKTPCWFQISPFKDRGYLLEILQRAQKAKCPVLLFTADLPLSGIRVNYHRKMQSSFLSQLMDEIAHLRWWLDVRLRGRPLHLGNLPQNLPHLTNLASMRAWMQEQLDPSFTWKDLEWIRDNWPGKLVVKGILDPQDAKKCEQLAIDGIVVSNHGARHLDGTLSSIAALPKIRDAAKTNMALLFDGGIRSGLDLVKALALGADACMIGKPWIYGLASRGEEGVKEVIALLHKELKITMAHLGVSELSEIHRGILDTKHSNP